MSVLDQPRLVSAPIPIRFAGWESNTYRLQQCGWQLSAREDSIRNVMRPQLQLALKHPDLQIRALTTPIDVDYLGMSRGAGHSIVEGLMRMGLDVQMFGSTLILNVMHQGPVEFRPIDAQPMWEDPACSTTTNIDDLKIFADAQLVRTEEVIVMPDNVPELMAHILKLQDPKQAEIRERVRKDKLVNGLQLEDVRPRQRFHAQILSLE
jgi:hypothetical protein